MVLIHNFRVSAADLLKMRCSVKLGSTSEDMAEKLVAFTVTNILMLLVWEMMIYGDR